MEEEPFHIRNRFTDSERFPGVNINMQRQELTGTEQMYLDYNEKLGRAVNLRQQRGLPLLTEEELGNELFSPEEVLKIFRPQSFDLQTIEVGQQICIPILSGLVRGEVKALNFEGIIMKPNDCDHTEIFYWDPHLKVYVENVQGENN